MTGATAVPALTSPRARPDAVRAHKALSRFFALFPYPAGVFDHRLTVVARNDALENWLGLDGAGRSVLRLHPDTAGGRRLTAAVAHAFTGHTAWFDAAGKARTLFGLAVADDVSAPRPCAPTLALFPIAPVASQALAAVVIAPAGWGPGEGRLVTAPVVGAPANGRTAL
ncbi:MAG: hypothetical protein LBO20_01485 [Bifidobacteriaceae bacterium]|jgi:hypothetical protein|nr:hypothetical protein [Bifidobacteriaceae bacterium]